MTSKEQVNSILQQYLEVFPGEVERCALFSNYLQANAAQSLYDRKNSIGHITTSAFIVRNTENGRQMLLLHHKILQRWFQPGGHADEADPALAASALREAVEETGLAAEHLSLYRHFPDDVPFDIDSHFIPENTKKNEAGHYHHDFRYLFLYNGPDISNFNAEESTGMKWVTFRQLASDPTFGAVVEKLSTVFN